MHTKYAISHLKWSMQPDDRLCQFIACEYKMCSLLSRKRIYTTNTVFYLLYQDFLRLVRIFKIAEIMKFI